MIDSKCLWVLCLLFILTGCQQHTLKNETSELAGINIAQQFVDAYNDHDENKMLSLVHPEIRYMYIAGDQIYTETAGRSKLAEFLTIFFKDSPNAQSKLLSSYPQGPFIHQVEQAVWHDENGRFQSQCSLSVYEIKQQLIINIWYFSTFKCPST